LTSLPTAAPSCASCPLPTAQPTAHCPLPTAAEESLRAVYRDGWSREQVAGLCAAVARHAAAGDAVAVEILERAAAELGALIAAVARRLRWGSVPLRVSAVGGVTDAGPPLRGPLERWLAAVLPHAQWKAPLGSPLEGAMLLAGEEVLLCQTS
jgi:N-acetylglucosamine kinase-like BadF-type ATPase